MTRPFPRSIAALATVGCAAIHRQQALQLMRHGLDLMFAQPAAERAPEPRRHPPLPPAGAIAAEVGTPAGPASAHIQNQGARRVPAQA